MKAILLLFSSFFLCLFFPSTAFASILITEVHPNPLSGPEWVELYNDAPTAADLSNWVLEDQLASPSVIQTFGTVTLPAQTYLKVDLATQKLNNTADGVTLKDAAG